MSTSNGNLDHFGTVDLDVDGAVATLTLRRPQKLNAMTSGMTWELARHVEWINAESTIRCVVLTGSGNRAFCVGSDIDELSEYESPWDFRNRADYADAVRRIRKPVVSAINGYAYGGGLELALACDIRLSAENATFAAPEIKLGWIGGAGQSYGLLHSVGPSNACWMLLTGDPIDARTAHSWGLVSEVTSADSLPSAARRLAEKLAERPPIAAETAKSTLLVAASQSVEFAIGYERDMQTFCFTTEDAAEGRAAFAERREPHFRGR